MITVGNGSTTTKVYVTILSEKAGPFVAKLFFSIFPNLDFSFE